MFGRPTPLNVSSGHSVGNPKAPKRPLLSDPCLPPLPLPSPASKYPFVVSEIQPLPRHHGLPLVHQEGPPDRGFEGHGLVALQIACCGPIVGDKTQYAQSMYSRVHRTSPVFQAFLCPVCQLCRLCPRFNLYLFFDQAVYQPLFPALYVRDRLGRGTQVRCSWKRSSARPAHPIKF